MEAALPAWLQALVDRHPLAVRQVRQHLRGRVHAALLVALPVIALALHGLSLALPDLRELLPYPFRGILPRALSPAFPLAVGLWTLVACVLVPWLAGRALRAERADGQGWDLLELTGLGGPAIAFGAWAAAVLQASLGGCLIAPFLVLAWLNRGVDLAAVLQALVAVPAWSAIACAVAINEGTTPKPKRGLHFGGLFALLFAWFFGCLLLGPPMPWWSSTGARTGLTMLGVILAVGGLLAAWLVAQAGANLSHAAEDRSSRPRFVVLVSALIIAGLGVVFVRPTRGGSLIAAGSIIAGLDVLAGLIASSERDGQTARQRAWRLHASRARRTFAPLLAPGCRAGRRFHLALAALALGLAGGAWLADARAGAGIVAALVCYNAAFILAADWLVRRAFAPAWHRPMAMVRVGIGLWLLSPVLAGLFIWVTGGDGSPFRILCWPIGMGAVAAAAIGREMREVGHAGAAALAVGLIGAAALAVTWVQSLGEELELRLRAEALESGR